MKNQQVYRLAFKSCHWPSLAVFFIPYGCIPNAWSPIVYLILPPAFPCCSELKYLSNSYHSSITSTGLNTSSSSMPPKPFHSTHRRSFFVVCVCASVFFLIFFFLFTSFTFLSVVFKSRREQKESLVNRLIVYTEGENLSNHSWNCQSFILFDMWRMEKTDTFLSSHKFKSCFIHFLCVSSPAQGCTDPLANLHFVATSHTFP